MPDEVPPIASETGAEGKQQTETTVIEQTATSAEKDWKAEAEKWQAMSRETEKKAAANARRIKEIEDRDLSELDRAKNQAAETAAELAEARAESLRWRIAATHGISSEDAELFLTGRDEETMTTQATRLAARQAAPPSKPELKPDLSQGPRGGGTSSPAQEFAEIIRNARGVTR